MADRLEQIFYEIKAHETRCTSAAQHWIDTAASGVQNQIPDDVPTIEVVRGIVEWVESRRLATEMLRSTLASAHAEIEQLSGEAARLICQRRGVPPPTQP